MQAKRQREARAEAAAQIRQRTQDFRAGLNRSYMAGQQDTVDAMNRALDGIDAAMGQYAGGFGSPAAGSLPPGSADLTAQAAQGVGTAVLTGRDFAETLQRRDELALRRWEEQTRAQALDRMVENLQNGRMPSGLPVESRGEDMENTAREGGGVRYSLRAFENGLRFVDVQTDQEQFDGLSDTEKTKLAVQTIKKKFAGRVVGVDNRVFVNGGSAAEYGHPAKNIDSDIRNAKMRASTELDNLIDAGTNFRTEPDGRDGHVHPEAAGDFQYFDTIFKVGTEYYTGVINIEQTARGLKLKDITKIRNITQDISSSYGETPKSTFLRDASMDSIFKSSQKVNGDFSQNQVESTLTASQTKPLQPGLVKDRLYRQANLTSRQQKTLDAIGRALGVEVRFAEQVDGGRANGSYAGGVITIALNSADPVGTVFAHEVVHRIREVSEVSYRRLERFVRENMSDRAMAAALAERGERYGSEDTGYLTEETVADAVGYLLGDTESLARLVQADLDLSRTLLDVVHDVVQKIRQTLRRDGSAALTERQREAFRDLESRLDGLELTLREAIGTAEAESTAAGNGEAKYEISRTLGSELDQVLAGTFPALNNDIYIGNTSKFLTDEIGISNFDVTMPPRKAYSAMVTEEQARKAGRYEAGMNYHGLGKNGLIEVLNASETPIAAFADTPGEKGKRANRIVLVTDKIISGQNVAVIEELETKGHRSGQRIDANKVITSYNRATLVHDIMQAAADGRLLALDEKRSRSQLAGARTANWYVAIQGTDFEANIRNFLRNVKWENSGEKTYTSESAWADPLPLWKQKLQEYAEGR